MLGFERLPKPLKVFIGCCLLLGGALAGVTAGLRYATFQVTHNLPVSTWQPAYSTTRGYKPATEQAIFFGKGVSGHLRLIVQADQPVTIGLVRDGLVGAHLPADCLQENVTSGTAVCDLGDKDPARGVVIRDLRTNGQAAMAGVSAALGNGDALAKMAADNSVRVTIERYACADHCN